MPRVATPVLRPAIYNHGLRMSRLDLKRGRERILRLDGNMLRTRHQFVADGERHWLLSFLG
jgi:hypothetical protein